MILIDEWKLLFLEYIPSSVFKDEIYEGGKL